MKKGGGRSKSQPRRKPLARGACVQRKHLPPMISLRPAAYSSSSDEEDDSGVVEAEIVNSEDTEDEDVAPKRGGNQPRPVSKRTRSRHQEEAATALLNLSTDNNVDDDDSFGADDDDDDDDDDEEEAKKAPQTENQVHNKGRRRMLRRRLVSLEKALNTTWKKGKPWWNNFDLFLLVAYNEYAPNKGGKQKAPQKRTKPQVIFFGRDSHTSNRMMSSLALRANVASLQCSVTFAHKPQQFMASLAKVDASTGLDQDAADEDDE
jgi:hypothetical protein